MRILIHDLNEKDFKNVFTNIASDITVISDNCKIHHCIGCFGCWVKTPAICMIHDSYENMGETLSKCEEIVIVSKCCYGGLSPFVKNVLDRSISYMHPYFTIRKGEMHHRRRYQNHFSLRVYFYGKDITKEEKETAQRLVLANSINLDCIKHEVGFFSDLQEMDGEII
jgi:multimeric flavodoxin WrbA